MRQPKLINIRGTSGAGKTTLMNAIMALYPSKTPVMISGRKQPLGYILTGLTDRPSLFVPGHYESPCGGCDTLGKYIPNVLDSDPADLESVNSYDFIFGLIKQRLAMGFDVVFEGLLISGDAARCTKLHQEGLPLSVVCINIPADECVASVIARRKAAGNEKPFNEDNTRDKHRLMQKCITKLRGAGVDVRDCPDRLTARIVVCELLEGSPAEGGEAPAPAAQEGGAAPAQATAPVEA